MPSLLHALAHKISAGENALSCDSQTGCDPGPCGAYKSFGDRFNAASPATAHNRPPPQPTLENAYVVRAAPLPAAPFAAAACPAVLCYAMPCTLSPSNTAHVCCCSCLLKANTCVSGA